MTILAGWRLNPRLRWQLSSLWPLLFIFIAAVYMAPDTKSMRNTYYLLVFLPGLVLLHRRDLRLLWHNPVLRAAALLLEYLWLSCFWSADYSAASSVKAGEQLVYLLIFLLVVNRCLNSVVRHHQLMVVMILAATIGALLSFWHFWDILQDRGMTSQLWTRRLTF